LQLDQANKKCVTEAATCEVIECSPGKYRAALAKSTAPTNNGNSSRLLPEK